MSLTLYKISPSPIGQDVKGGRGAREIRKSRGMLDLKIRRHTDWTELEYHLLIT